jgi:hypothetical protein
LFCYRHDRLHRDLRQFSHLFFTLSHRYAF